MNSNILKISRIVSIAFMILGVLFIILVLSKGDDAIKNSIEAQNSVLTPFFYIAYIILGLTALLSIAFPVAYAFGNPKQAIRGLVVIGLFVVLFGISYLLASDNISTEMVAKAVEDGRVSTAGIRRVGMGLIATYILVAVTIIVTVYSGISKFFK